MTTTPLTTTPLTTTQRSRTAADETAVASFILGLLGLFFFNVVLGPLALILAGVSLTRGTSRRGRALIGLALGIADLAVLGVLLATHTGGLPLRPVG